MRQATLAPGLPSCPGCQGAIPESARFCPDCGRPAREAALPLLSQVWWRVLAIGLVLYWLTSELLKVYGNPNFAPTVMLLGAFLVPTVFVTYLYETDALYDISPVAVALTFLYGGILGSVAAQVLEAELVTGTGLIGMLAVGISEEIAKPLGLLWLARRRDISTEMHGLILGAAAGMGFAAIETMGYAFTYFILSHGSLDVLGQVLLNRGLLAPFAHGTWTAILAGALWRERSRNGRFVVNRPVVKAYVLVVVMHALWDWTANNLPIDIGIPEVVLSGQLFDVVVPAINLPVPGLIIGAWGVIVLWRMFREARKMPSAATPAPPMGEPTANSDHAPTDSEPGTTLQT